MSNEVLGWLSAAAVALGLVLMRALWRADRKGQNFIIVIDEDRKLAGWGNHFAVAPKDEPSAYIYVGSKQEAVRRCTNLNCGRPELA